MPKVEDEIIVDAPVETVYQAWHNFENFPAFMDNIEDVRVVGGGRSHWKAKGPLGTDAEWDAEMTLDEPNNAIGWRSLEGNGSVKTAGRVNFASAGNGSTKLRVVLDYDAPAGAAGNIVAKIFSNPERQMKDDLQRFKQTIEKGEELSGLAYGGERGARGETLGGSMGPTTSADLEKLDEMNTSDTAPQDVDDPATRSGGG